jgi:hypothetical protein
MEDINETTTGKGKSKETPKTEKPVLEIPKVEETVNLHSFINARKYSVGVEHRIERHLNGDNSSKTTSQWETIYSEVMNRKTN